MTAGLDDTDWTLLDGWQRDFPLVRRPFRAIGETIGAPEEVVLGRYRALSEAGVVSRIGATCRPNTLGASTLAAVAAPECSVDEVAELIADEPGVNHCYLRENHWNIWFVATGPSRADVDRSLARIEARAGLKVLDLRLIRPFNVDLGFSLRETRPVPHTAAHVGDAALEPIDRLIAQELSAGLPLIPEPFAALANRVGLSEPETRARISELLAARFLSRFGVIVRHRALGWRSNAMVVWDAPESAIERAGAALVASPGVTLCYQRRRIPDFWPYSLYCMIHARSRSEALENLERATEAAGLQGVPRQILFSLRCFKQTGALIHTSRAAEGAAA